MIKKFSQVPNEIDMMALGKVRDPTKCSDKLLKLLQSDAGSRELKQMAKKADGIRDYLKERNINDILYTNKKRNAVIGCIEESVREVESIEIEKIDDINPSHNNQARKTNGEDNLTASRAQND